MLRHSILVLAIAVLVGFVVSLGTRLGRPPQAVPSPPPPQSIVMEPSTMQLGDLTWGRPVSGTLRLTASNDLTGPILIASLDSSCGCTVFQEELVGRALSPGEAVDLEFQFNPGIHVGEKSSRISVVASDGTVATATIAATVRGTWRIDTDQVDFGTVCVDCPNMQSPSEERALERTVQFTAAPDALLSVNPPTATWLSVDIGEQRGLETEIHLTVRTDRLPSGLNAASAMLQTTSQDRPTGVIAVRARGVRALEPSVHRVVLHGVTPLEITVSAYGGAAVNLTRAESDDAALEIEIVEPDRISIRNRLGDVGERADRVVVHTEGGASCEIWVLRL
ncbi:MAG: DUF1573 domain-containing protein [Planctomycetes bacterium]|nr:DUF1573 domain-containing protein [Planctomycetota bacterium]